MHHNTARADLRELPLVADKLGVRPVHARLAGAKRAVRKTWLGWEIAAYHIDFTDRAADAATIFENHGQVAGTQQLLTGRLTIGPQDDTESQHAPVAKVDHQPSLIRRAVLDA